MSERELFEAWANDPDKWTDDNGRVIDDDWHNWQVIRAPLLEDNAILLADRKKGDEIYAHICVSLVNAGYTSFGKATDALDALIAERDRLRARVASLEDTIRALAEPEIRR